jgi:hypothetical protein
VAGNANNRGRVRFISQDHVRRLDDGDMLGVLGLGAKPQF